ncbi:MAG TPA: hypothetical protein VEA44_00745 [Caulobacter sp.]|nr:hypothetical protein [Caulobacter sp.]
MIKALDRQPRTRRGRILMAVAVVGSIGGMIVALVSLRMDLGLIGLPIAAASVCLSLVSLHASRRWWAEADEAVKEAHKTGWYWGGSTGLAVAGGIMALMFAIEPSVSLRQLALFPGDAGLVATGLLTAIVLTFAGYVVGWATWWMVRGR